MNLLRAAVLTGALFAPFATAVAQNPAGGFGRALAVDKGDVLVGHANNQINPGAVLVFRKVAGKWTEQAKLVSSQAAPSDGFGTSIAIAGDWLLVGAPSANDQHGAVFVFQRSAKGTWHEVAVLTGDTAKNTGFGTSVVAANDLAVVATPLAEDQAGAAHVFRRTGNRWVRETRLTSPEPAPRQLFGQGIAINNGQILIGEPGYAERTGRVHAFRRASGAWSAAAQIAPAAAQKGDRFGAPIAVDGERVLVGAPGFSGNLGAVFAFVPAAAGWREAGRLLAADGKPGEQFGGAIAARDGHVWVGSPRSNGFRGVVYHVVRAATDTTTSLAQRLDAGELAAQSFFGATLTAGQTVAAAGALNADFGLGSVVLFEKGSGSEWALATTLHATDERIQSIAGKKECSNGKSAQFACSDVELLSYVSVPDLGGGRGVQLNDIWGWTDPETGKEWALVGRMDGTSFVDISNPEKPVYVANLPLTPGANPNVWRDIKVYRNHAYIVADGAGKHGMQVFDLTRLRNVKQPPVTFEADHVYTNIASSHNIVINEQTGFAYAVGASGGGETCGGGLHMIDLKTDPKKPTFAGCFADPQTGRANTGYSHDAQCVVYKGPDARYAGREICLGSNETMLSIADVTDKKAPRAVGRASYPNVGYSHQGWLDESHQYFYMDDELDEIQGSAKQTRTIIWDLTKLDDPQVATMYLSPTAASDHNLYIKGDTMYQSHYKAGLRIVDIRNRTAPVEIGYFDTVPYGDNTPGFGGSWSNYPYFKSGVIIATSMNEGLFVLKKKTPKPVS